MGFLEIFLKDATTEIVPLELAASPPELGRRKKTLQILTRGQEKLKRTLDPYCEFRLITSSGSVLVCKSRKIKDSNTPVWNEKLLIQKVEPHFVEMQIRVWNWSKVLQHMPIGECVVDLSNENDFSSPREFEVDLSRTGTGKIKFSVHYKEGAPQKDIVLEGYLEKRGKIHSIWNSRWFVLSSDGLFWYQHQNSEQSLGAVLNLEECEVIISSNKVDMKQLMSQEKGAFFTLQTVDKKYHLKAKNATDRGKWLKALKECGCKSSATSPPSSPKTQRRERKSFFHRTSTMDLNVSKESKAEVYQNNQLETVEIPADEKPLPQGWEIHIDSKGRRYFVDTINRDETYDDPREQEEADTTCSEDK